MPIKMVREPSDSPNITNIDDFVGLKFAYHDQNGYVPSRGSEFAYEISGTDFRVLSGRAVVQGIECDIDANGVVIPVDVVATKRYHLVCIQVSLSSMSVQVISLYDTANVPEVPNSDDLTNNTIGSAYIALYSFVSVNGVVSDVQKLIPEVRHTRAISQSISETVSNLLKDQLETGEVVPLKAKTAQDDYQAVVQPYSVVKEQNLPASPYGYYTPLNIHLQTDRVYTVSVTFYANSIIAENDPFYDQTLHSRILQYTFIISTSTTPSYSTQILVTDPKAVSADDAINLLRCLVEYRSLNDVRLRMFMNYDSTVYGTAGIDLTEWYSGNIRVSCSSQ